MGDETLPANRTCSIRLFNNFTVRYSKRGSSVGSVWCLIFLFELCTLVSNLNEERHHFLDCFSDILYYFFYQKIIKQKFRLK